MARRRVLNKTIAVTITVLAACCLTLAACASPSSSNGSADNSSTETKTEAIAQNNTYIIEGFTGARSGSDGRPTPDSKMQTVPSIEVSFPTTWNIVEMEIDNYEESKYGTRSNTVVLEGPTGLRATIKLAANVYGGAHAKGTNIEVIGSTGIEDISLAWANTPEYDSSYIQYINQKYIDAQEAGTLDGFPSLAYLQEGTINCSLYVPEPGKTPINANKKTYVENDDLDTAFAILESVRIAK